jgi:hypothetical protein
MADQVSRALIALAGINVPDAVSAAMRVNRFLLEFPNVPPLEISLLAGEFLVSQPLQFKSCACHKVTCQIT